MPVGANDRGDRDMTAAAALHYNSGEPGVLTLEDVAGAGLAGRERLRVSAILLDASGSPVAQYPQAFTISDDEAVIDGATSAQFWFDITTGQGNLGGAALANMPYASRFGISAFCTAGVGVVRIMYRLETASPYRLFEDVPLSANYPVDKVSVPSRRQYLVYYIDTADGVATAGLDLQVVLYPSPA